MGGATKGHAGINMEDIFSAQGATIIQNTTVIVSYGVAYVVMVSDYLILI